MREIIAKAIREYETGKLSRRELVAGLSALFATLASTTGAQEASATFRAVNLNHVALAVTDIPRSRDFYIRHFGMRVSSESSNSCFLDFGDSFLALFRRNSPGMDHYCYGVEGYQADDAAEKLRAVGIEPRVRGSRVYFEDPDGLTVQLASAGHRA